ncbi:amidase family protein [Streptomyces lichenis]|uniref:Amidase family protein n=1 Tax=Streptomyces lichenis TaxID=2306967 RepID=A0ABT0IFW1_9ACTN|nr:amidase family protein [Streptomyces lichenis]MCK8680204.1 amidase family protein [Streptomyces lichenis]
MTAPGPLAEIPTTACAIAAAVHAGELTTRDTAAAALERMAERDTLRAFTAPWPDLAAAQAPPNLTTLAATSALDLHQTPVHLPDPVPSWQAHRRRPTAALADAARQSAALTHHLDAVFDQVDLIATPTTPNPPHGHQGPGATMSVALTWAFNITGHPAISLPSGLTPSGEPVGLQLIARHHHEADLLAVAAAAEAIRPHERVSPAELLASQAFLISGRSVSGNPETTNLPQR